MVSVRFLGAVGTVTGSKFLVETSTARILIDAGLFQGRKELRLRNWAPFPVDPASIDAIVLTHAHLDHCGYIPLLVRQGFSGPIFSTVWTRKLAELILFDSARLQVEDAEYARRKGYSKHAQPLPLYDEQDVERALGLFRPIDLHHATPIAEGARLTLHRAGHILGSTFAEVSADGARLLFSGDLGRPYHPVLAPPDPIPHGRFDLIVTEGTYGDREHQPPAIELIADTIRRTARRGGTVVIPAFAVDRTEVVLITLRRLMESGQIPSLPIIVDSPMALLSMAHYVEAAVAGSPEIRDELIADARVRNPFDPGTLTAVRAVEESKALNEPSGARIIISASGMATGGRVVHHLEHLLPHAMNSVLLVGYQAAGTRGRSLLEGAKTLRMYGRDVEVRAEVVEIPSMSVHADWHEILAWLGSASEAPGQVIVVHGEEAAAATMAGHIRQRFGWLVSAPHEESEVAISAPPR
jgi:metallo-beta-lactamase family protein